MYKLFVTTVGLIPLTQHETHSVHTVVIEFATIEEAEFAYAQLKGRDTLMQTKREVVKLYDDICVNTDSPERKRILAEFMRQTRCTDVGAIPYLDTCKWDLEESLRYYKATD